MKADLPGVAPAGLHRQGYLVRRLDRKVTEKEYRRVRDHMLSLGLPGYLQEPASADPDFVPAFNQEDSFIS